MTTEKKIKERLAKHSKLMNEFMNKGMSRAEASKKASDILFPSLSKIIRNNQEVKQ